MTYKLVTKFHAKLQLLQFRFIVILSASCVLLLATPAPTNAILKNHETLSRPYYVAAVVEFSPNGTVWDSSPQELILRNVNHYVQLISEANQHNVDIIVFPEYGITTLGVPRDRERARPYLVEVPRLNVNPCSDHTIVNNTDPIEILSCAAKTYGIYVVVNLGEILSCDENDTEECPADGFLQYNTNVVFDRFGTIVAKYHKTHLYFEEQFNSPTIPEHSIFETDFGVTFGQFICYDIIFYEPAVELVSKGVQNIIFTSAWVDELPFLMAPQSQALWASSANVNLLASGYHQPIGGQLGSGIFSGTIGPLNYTFDPNSGTKLVLAEVPKAPGENSNETRPIRAQINAKTETPSTDNHFYLKEDLRNYSSVILDLKDTNSEKVCHGNFCCSIKFSASVQIIPTPSSNTDSVNYRLIAFDGIRKTAQETAEFGWQVCALVRCLNRTLSSCSFKDQTAEDEDLLERFTYIELEGSPFASCRNGKDVMQPSLNTLTIGMSVIPFELFQLETIEDGKVFKVTADERLAQYSIQSISIIKRTYK